VGLQYVEGEGGDKNMEVKVKCTNYINVTRTLVKINGYEY
jgi:hypothetical protein